MSHRIRRRVAAMLVALMALFALTIPVLAQDGPPGPEILNGIARFLTQKLGRPVPSIDNYVYEILTFPNVSLGCPVEGQTYTTGDIRAYKFIVDVKGIAFDVRTTLDGTLSVLCPGAELRQSSTLAIYRNTAFSVGYPEKWSIIDRQIDIFFGLSPTPVCTQPGMIVTPLGTVSTDKTADELLNEYSLTISNAKFEEERTTIRGTARSVLYTAPCTDGSPRQNRVTIFVSYGKAYRVLQFTPQNAFYQWADVFLKVLNEFSPSSAGGSGGSDGKPVTMPGVAPLASIGHVFAGNVYVGSLLDLPGTPITTDAINMFDYGNISISPNGDRVAYVNSRNGTLYTASIFGGDIKTAAEGLAVPIISWNPLADEIVFLKDEGKKDGEKAILAVMVVSPDGSNSRKIGETQPFTVGCETEIGDYSEKLYWADTGVHGNSLLLHYSMGGVIYYSLGCDGVGVGMLTDDSGQSEVLTPDLRRVQFSPDGTKILGVIGTENTLVRLKLDDRTVELLKTAAPVDQFAWSKDGNLVYYSSLTVKDTILLDSDEDRERGLAQFGTWPFQIPVFEVSMHQLDLITNVDTELFKADGRAIGRILPSPDASGVLFTFIQHAASLAEAFRNNVPESEFRRQMPTKQFYWITVPGGSPQLLAISAAPVWGPLGSALAPTPTGGFHMTITPTPFITPPPVVVVTSTPTPSANNGTPVPPVEPTSTAVKIVG